MKYATSPATSPLSTDWVREYQFAALVCEADVSPAPNMAKRASCAKVSSTPTRKTATAPQQIAAITLGRRNPAMAPPMVAAAATEPPTTAYTQPSMLIVMIANAPSSPSTSPVPVVIAKRTVGPSVRRRPTAATTASATAAPPTRLAEIAPGRAYAVEVTSISAFARPVMVARADHRSPAIHARPTRASAMLPRLARSVRTGASSCVLMRVRVRVSILNARSRRARMDPIPQGPQFEE